MSNTKTLDSAIANWNTKPHMNDYESIRKSFIWENIKDKLEGLPNNGGLNIAHEAVDRHAHSDKANQTAIRWIGMKGDTVDITYLDLKEETNRFANVLQKLNIGKGDAVFSLLGRVPELYFAALGTLKNTSVFCPLFSAFGPDPIIQRMGRGKAKVLVTTKRLYLRKIKGILDQLPTLEFILLIDEEDNMDSKVLSLSTLITQASIEFEIPRTSPDDHALMHFTSGTTGMPKGAVHIHNAVLTHYATGKYVMDFHEGDIFWCTADPGWVTGTSYGIISPLLHGLTNIIVEAEFDALQWFKILQQEKVNIWYTAPTAIRRLMRLEIKPKDAFDLNALRLIHSVGEPLNPEAIVWAQDAIGIPIHDNWWQTETGGIMISNFPSMPIRPGSMGKPLPGIEAAILTQEGDSWNTNTPIDTIGELALKKGWPSEFVTYLDEEERYQKCFWKDWYLTGDLAKVDEDGYYWFVGRSKDIIKTSGHMVGPFEVESALMEHTAVAEAAVIGLPDQVAGEIVQAYVSLNSGHEWSPELQLELIGFGRKRLGAAVAPKAIDHVDNLPKTKSGKIMRRLLKARALGLPEGDTSTLEKEN